MASQEGRWEEKQERVALSCGRAVWGQAAHSERGNNRLSVIGKLDSFCWLEFIWATYPSKVVFCFWSHWVSQSPQSVRKSIRTQVICFLVCTKSELKWIEFKWSEKWIVNSSRDSRVSIITRVFGCERSEQFLHKTQWKNTGHRCQTARVCGLLPNISIKCSFFIYFFSLFLTK